jgi:hypothetical protein
MAVMTLRCSDGHLFTATPVKLTFLSAHFIDRVWLRCPVDRKWRMASIVAASTLSEAELDEAKQYRF